jgi:hypothetical protein
MATGWERASFNPCPPPRVRPRPRRGPRRRPGRRDSEELDRLGGPDLRGELFMGMVSTAVTHYWSHVTDGHPAPRASVRGFIKWLVYRIQRRST